MPTVVVSSLDGRVSFGAIAFNSLKEARLRASVPQLINSELPALLPPRALIRYLVAPVAGCVRRGSPGAGGGSAGAAGRSSFPRRSRHLLAGVPHCAARRDPLPAAGRGRPPLTQIAVPIDIPLPN